jgi:hypothetical protein
MSAQSGARHNRVVVGAAIIILGVADWAPLSGGDGAVTAFALTLLKPWLAPYVLILLSAIQDAPGIEGAWWYVAFVSVAFIMILKEARLLQLALSFADGIYRDFAWAVVAIAVTSYALVWSAVLDLSGFRPQSAERNFAIVASLIIFMIIAGVTAYHSVRRLPDWENCLRSCVAIVVGHGLLVATFQLLIDPSLFASRQWQVVIEGTDQLTATTAFGFPRIHGTYLTPNGFALSYALILLFLLQTYMTKPVSISFAILYALISIGLSVVTLSKAGGVFALMTSAVLLTYVSWHPARHRLFRRLCFCVIAFAVVGSLVALDLEKVQQAFRFSFGGISELGLRSDAWEATVKYFTYLDWALGTGLSHWKVFFSQHISYPLADPHTFVLSIPGTFGLVGTIFYLALLVMLFSNTLQNGGTFRLVGLTLLILFLVRDLVEIPLLLNNTPITFLIWMHIAHIVNGPQKDQDCCMPERGLSAGA